MGGPGQWRRDASGERGAYLHRLPPPHHHHQRKNSWARPHPENEDRVGAFPKRVLKGYATASLGGLQMELELAGAAARAALAPGRKNGWGCCRCWFGAGLGETLRAI